MKKIISLLLIATMVLSFFTAGCAADASALTVCVGPYPDSIDPALNSTSDGGTYIIHAFSGLVGYKQDAEGKLTLVADCAKELPEAQPLSEGKVSYTYELRDNLKWSDGTPLTAQDFVYAWNRAVSPETAADYSYMFDVIDGYKEASEGNGALNITASDDGRSLKVVLSADVPYFNELCAFPVYMPVKQSSVEGNESWAINASTYIGNGPYRVTEFTQAGIVMEKNQNYHNAGEITTEKIVFAFNEDDNSLLANFKNGSYLFVDSVPSDQIQSVSTMYPAEYQVIGQMGTYYISFNVNDKTLGDFTEEERVKLRKALGLLLERNYICNQIVMASQQPANTFTAMGLTDADGVTEFRLNANGGEGYFSVSEEDYADNCREATELFEAVAKSSGRFTVADGKVQGFPTLTYITNEGTAHEAIATYMQGVYAKYGITLEIEVQEWNTFLNTRKAGDYSLARNGWLCDYNDPISMLDMWTTYSGNNDSQLGKDNHSEYRGYSVGEKSGLTWAESYDRLIEQIKASSDKEERYELMHQAEDLLMSTGAICPIYYNTDQYLCSQRLQGFFASPLGLKYFMYASFNA